MTPMGEPVIQEYFGGLRPALKMYYEHRIGRSSPHLLPVIFKIQG